MHDRVQHKKAGFIAGPQPDIDYMSTSGHFADKHSKTLLHFVTLSSSRSALLLGVCSILNSSKSSVAAHSVRFQWGWLLSVYLRLHLICDRTHRSSEGGSAFHAKWKAELPSLELKTRRDIIRPKPPAWIPLLCSALADCFRREKNQPGKVELALWFDSFSWLDLRGARSECWTESYDAVWREDNTKIWLWKQERWALPCYLSITISSNDTINLNWFCFHNLKEPQIISDKSRCLFLFAGFHIIWLDCMFLLIICPVCCDVWSDFNFSSFVATF